MVAVVCHLTGHAAVNADVLACDEARLVGTEIEHHVCNIQGIAHTSDWLLHGVGTLVNGIGGVNPTGRNTVHAYPARQTYGKSMGQCRNAALCSRLALCLRLAHAVARGRDVHDGSTFGEIRGEELGEVERSRHAYAHGILELLVAALVDALHQRQGIIDEEIHMTVLIYHFFSELLQYLFVSKVANKVVALLLIYHTSRSACFLKLFRNTPSDALCTTSYYGYFSFEIHIIFRNSCNGYCRD